MSICLIESHTHFFRWGQPYYHFISFLFLTYSFYRSFSAPLHAHQLVDVMKWDENGSYIGTMCSTYYQMDMDDRSLDDRSVYSWRRKHFLCVQSKFSPIPGESMRSRNSMEMLVYMMERKMIMNPMRQDR